MLNCVWRLVRQSPRSYDFSQKTVYGGWCRPLGLCFNCPRYIITANLLSSDLKLKEHMKDLSIKLGLFIDSVPIGENRLDSFLRFHMDIFVHGDGELSDLRDKAANLFSRGLRSRSRTRSRRRILLRTLIQVSILISPPLFHLWKLGIHPFSLLLLYCCLLLWDLLSIQFQHWTNCL